MDLSKAFDMIPHDLLVAKLYAYGFSVNAICELIKNYLSDRLQRVKLDNDRSECMSSVVPQLPATLNRDTADIVIGSNCACLCP